MRLTITVVVSATLLVSAGCSTTSPAPLDKASQADSSRSIALHLDQTSVREAISELARLTRQPLAVDPTLGSVLISGSFDGSSDQILSRIAEAVGAEWIDSTATVWSGREAVTIRILTDAPDRFIAAPCQPLEAPYFGPCIPARMLEGNTARPFSPPPGGLPYFGERLPQMPPNHFSTPLAPAEPPVARDRD